LIIASNVTTHDNVLIPRFGSGVNQLATVVFLFLLVGKGTLYICELYVSNFYWCCV